jgi:hypothetical protein
MLISELTKGTPTPTSEPAQMMEEALQEQADEAPAEEPAPDAAVDDTMTDDAATPLDDGTPVDETVKALDMERWERKAIKGLRRFKARRAAVREQRNRHRHPRTHYGRTEGCTDGAGSQGGILR